MPIKIDPQINIHQITLTDDTLGGGNPMNDLFINRNTSSSRETFIVQEGRNTFILDDELVTILINVQSGHTHFNIPGKLIHKACSQMTGLTNALDLLFSLQTNHVLQAPVQERAAFAWYQGFR
ncbi:hypothetical protein SDC9_104292 [bioreactor metagenome]|uniref:Uncharacterized protein n=1 Tax=bioreactor metagenome TaxID=1076179 RepID=A0A645AWD9_9ZZZZ